MAITDFLNSKDVDFDDVKAIFKNHIAEYWINAKDKSVADLKLDIIGDETLTADSDVTDHYVESNQPFQDQIALKPKTYTISGEVGELVWYQQSSTSQIVGQVAQKLEGVISFLPIRSKKFNQMKNTVMKASQWVDTASNAITKLSTLAGEYARGSAGGEDFSFQEAMSRQQQAYHHLLFMRDSRTPVDVRTPWGILSDYIISNLELRQPKDSKDKSFITITFKEFRTTSVRLTKFDINKYQGNAAFENQPEEKHGETSGKDISLPTEEEETAYGDFKMCPLEGTDLAAFENDGILNFQNENGEIVLNDDPGYNNAVRDAANMCTGRIRDAAIEEAKMIGIKL